MLTESKQLPNSRLLLTITGSVAQYRHAFEHELSHVGKGLTIPGFRPGKAPEAKVIEKVGRPRIEAGALDHLISDAYYDAVQEAGVTPVEGPKVEIVTFKTPGEDAKEDEEVVTFTAEVDVIPTIDVSGYKKVKIKKADEPTITEDELEKVLEYLRKQHAIFKEVDEGVTVEGGMWTDLTYEGSVGGVKRSDMKNEHHPIVVGEGQLIPGFEDQIIGMKPGEEKTIKVTFPEKYNASELAGKEAEFIVKVNELKQVILPEKDDGFAVRFGHKKYAELESSIQDSLKEEKQTENRQKMEEELVEELIKAITFEIPLTLVDQEMERMFKDAQIRLEKMNFNWDTYLAQVGKTVEEVREDMRPQAEKNVRIGLILGRIMQDQGIAEQEGAGRLVIEKLLEEATK